jgi:hypothetical protein
MSRENRCDVTGAASKSGSVAGSVKSTVKRLTPPGGRGQFLPLRNESWRRIQDRTEMGNIAAAIRRFAWHSPHGRHLPVAAFEFLA